MRSTLKKLDSFSLETSKNHLIRNFLRNGRLRVKYAIQILNEGDERACSAGPQIWYFMWSKNTSKIAIKND